MKGWRFSLKFVQISVGLAKEYIMWPYKACYPCTCERTGFYPAKWLNLHDDLLVEKTNTWLCLSAAQILKHHFQYPFVKFPWCRFWTGEFWKGSRFCYCRVFNPVLVAIRSAKHRLVFAKNQVAKSRLRSFCLPTATQWFSSRAHRKKNNINCLSFFRIRDLLGWVLN